MGAGIADGQVARPAAPRRITIARALRRDRKLLRGRAGRARRRGAGRRRAAAAPRSSGGTDADPASAVPATTPLYVGADVRPTGSRADGALAAGKALTGAGTPTRGCSARCARPARPRSTTAATSSPGSGRTRGCSRCSLSSAQALVAPLTASLSGSGPVAPLPFSAGGLDGALVMDTRDAGAARSFLAAQAKRAGAHPSSYRGVSYEVSPGGVAFGLVKSFAVIGSEAGLRAVIGVTQGEAALASASGYSKLAGSAPSGAIAHLYVSPGSAGAGRRCERRPARRDRRRAGRPTPRWSRPPARCSSTSTRSRSRSRPGAGARAGLLALRPRRPRRRSRNCRANRGSGSASGTPARASPAPRAGLSALVLAGRLRTGSRHAEPRRAREGADAAAEGARRRHARRAARLRLLDGLGRDLRRRLERARTASRGRDLLDRREPLARRRRQARRAAARGRLRGLEGHDPRNRSGRRGRGCRGCR